MREKNSLWQPPNHLFPGFNPLCPYLGSLHISNGRIFRNFKGFLSELSVKELGNWTNVRAKFKNQLNIDNWPDLTALHKGLLRALRFLAFPHAGLGMHRCLIVCWKPLVAPAPMVIGEC